MISPPRSRNDPCPCGSGVRYKHCHGRAEAVAATRSAGGSEAHALRARALAATHEPDRAEGLWLQVLAREPRDAEALFHLGNLARMRGNAALAVERFSAALASAPAHIAVLNNLGLALEAAGKIVAAEPVFRQALAVAPVAIEPLANLAQNLYQQKRYAEALPLFDSLTAKFTITQPEIVANRSVCLAAVGRLDEAAAGLARALDLDPSSTSLARDLAVHYLRMKRYGEAIPLLERTVAASPSDFLARSLLVGAKLHVARWDGFADDVVALVDAARDVDARPGTSLSAFDFAVVCDDPELQRRAARSWIRAQGTSNPLPAQPLVRRSHPLRVGFVSTDFHEHPVGRLVVALIERIDRSACAAAVYAIGPPRSDAIARRFEAAADIYRVAPHVDATAIAATMRADQIDVAIDLNGLTGTQLASIFVERAAPVQASFVGYTGTLGSRAIDWLIADRYCTPPEQVGHYDERVIYVDPCYLPSDPTRDCDSVTVTRSEYGLPEHGVVFGAPAPTYKISPPLFARWMTLLARHAGSVLWLRPVATDGAQRLREAARGHGVDASRLVFAPVEPLPRYLARARLADLVLDTHPFGAHTSVNDALYAGVPVVTIAGCSFAGRASASQLAAAGVPELIAQDGDEYSSIADRYAADPTLRAATAARLREARTASPLFDIDRYARTFENALVDGWDRTLTSA